MGPIVSWQAAADRETEPPDQEDSSEATRCVPGPAEPAAVRVPFVRDGEDRAAAVACRWCRREHHQLRGRYCFSFPHTSHSSRRRLLPFENVCHFFVLYACSH